MYSCAYVPTKRKRKDGPIFTKEPNPWFRSRLIQTRRCYAKFRPGTVEAEELELPPATSASLPRWIPRCSLSSSLRAPGPRSSARLLVTADGDGHHLASPCPVCCTSHAMSWVAAFWSLAATPVSCSGGGGQYRGGGGTTMSRRSWVRAAAGGGCEFSCRMPSEAGGVGASREKIASKRRRWTVPSQGGRRNHVRPIKI